jgi:gas vesicle protein
MIRRSLLLTALLVAPSLAAAQRTTAANKHTEMMPKDDGPKGPALRVRDIEDQSPLRLLIDKRKDLALTDAQLSQIKDAEGKLKEKNAPLYKSVDSLIHELRPSSNTPTADEKIRLRSANSSLMNVIGDIRMNYDASAKDAVALLTADQQTKANELLAKQREEADRTVREKLGSGRG